MAIGGDHGSPAVFFRPLPRDKVHRKAIEEEEVESPSSWLPCRRDHLRNSCSVHHTRWFLCMEADLRGEHLALHNPTDKAAPRGKGLHWFTFLYAFPIPVPDTYSYLFPIPIPYSHKSLSPAGLIQIRARV